MAYLYQGSQETDNVQKQDEQKQDATMLTNATGDLGAEMAEGSVSGSSDRPKDMARSPALSTSQVLNRNLNKSGNPFQFDKTRQALAGSKGQVQSEYNTYMQNAVTPYQYGTQQQEQVRQYARGQAPSGQPDWLSRFQQGTPTGPGAFTSTAQTSFAPVNALKTNAGVRNFLRDPNDPETRSGEAAIDFSILNADPQFNINREQTLKDYEDLINTKGNIEANAQAEARKAQLDAASKYRQGITSTLEEEAAALEKAAQEEETAYDRGFGSLDRNALARAEIQDLYNTGPENLRPYLGSGIGAEYDQFFNPLTGESTKAEDFITGEQAANFNRIMAALGREGKVAAKGRLAGQKGPGSEALQFDKQAFRNKVLNDAFARANAPSPFAGTDAYNAGPPLAPLPPPAMPNPVAGTLAIPTDMPYVNPMDYAYSPMPEVQSPYMGNIMPGTLNIGYSHGGRVPGEAPTMGDSPANDVVDAKLSPGEIVIPRSAAGDKESAKEFIDNMPFSKTRELLKNKYACGGKVQDQYNCGGMVKRGYADGGMVEPNHDQELLDKSRSDYLRQMNEPIPQVEKFKSGLDDYLTENVVNPFAKAGFENIGAILATIPSTAAEAILPGSKAEMQGPIIPMKGIRLGKKAREVNKQFKTDQAANLLEKMSADDVDIAKLPDSKEFNRLNKEYKKQKYRQEVEQVSSRAAKNKQDARNIAGKGFNEIFGKKRGWDFPTDVLDEVAQTNLHNPEIAKAYAEVEMLAKEVPWGSIAQQGTTGKVFNNLKVQDPHNAFQIARKNLYEAIMRNKNNLKFDDNLESLKKIKKLSDYK